MVYYLQGLSVKFGLPQKIKSGENLTYSLHKNVVLGVSQIVNILNDTLERSGTTIHIVFFLEESFTDKMPDACLV